MSTKTPSLSPPASLQAVIDRITAMEHLAPQRRKDLCSAVRRIATLLARPVQDIEPDVAALRVQLARFTPAAAGMTPQRWRNVRALLTAALSLAGTTVTRRRTANSLPSAWAELLARLSDRYERSRLSRLATDCAAKGIAPQQVNDAVADAFGHSLLQTSLVKRPKQVHRDACLAWNRAVAAVPGWPAIHLTVPDHSRAYALPVDAYPASFGADVDAYLQHLSGRDLFAETARHPASPSTLRTNRLLLLQFAAALVLSGRDPATLTSLSALVQIDAAKTGLEFLWKRAGEQKSGHLHQYAMLLVKLAKHWARLPDEQIVQLQALRKRLDPGQTGMTPRNRARLRQFDDPTNLARLIDLPRAILRAFPTAEPLAYQQAVTMQSALAIGILLTAPMRIKNLAGLTLDRHLLQTRPGGVRHLVLPAQEVKNKSPLEFPLSAEVQSLLTTYLERARPILAQTPSTFLFPARSGGSKPEAQLAVQVKRTIAQQIGLDLNVHAFRHLAAMLFLRRFPGDYETVRLLLGHKSLVTTTRAYCGMEQTDALRRYDELIDQYRQVSDVE